MNELAYYLERYFAELESQEVLAVEGMGSSRGVIDRAGEGKSGCCVACDRLIVLGIRAKDSSREAGQAQHKKLVKAGL